MYEVATQTDSYISTPPYSTGAFTGMMAYDNILLIFTGITFFYFNISDQTYTYLYDSQEFHNSGRYDSVNGTVVLFGGISSYTNKIERTTAFVDTQFHTLDLRLMQFA